MARKRHQIYRTHIRLQIKAIYNFEELQNLYDISNKDYLKYYHIVNNIHEDWTTSLKEETPRIQEPNDKTKKLNILNAKQNKIIQFLYSSLIQSQDNSNKMSERIFRPKYRLGLCIFDGVLM